MGFFGLFLFLVGGAGAVFFGGFGVDGVANIAGTLIGCALLISGAVFWASHRVLKAHVVTLVVKGNEIDLKPIGGGVLAGPGEGAEIICFASVDEAEKFYAEREAAKRKHKGLT
jgi:hypothetical protein